MEILPWCTKPWINHNILFIFLPFSLLTCALNKSNSDSSKDTKIALTALSSPWNLSYVDSTNVSISTDMDSLYFTFEVIDTTQITRKQQNFHKGVGLSDRVELFFGKDSLLSMYYGLEIGIDCRVFDFHGFYPDSIDYDWTLPESEYLFKCKQEKTNYKVNGSISMKSLKALGLIEHNRLYLGIFRADYYDDEDPRKVTWLSWQIPQSETPQFHIPSAFKTISLYQ